MNIGDDQRRRLEQLLAEEDSDGEEAATTTTTTPPSTSAPSSPAAPALVAPSIDPAPAAPSAPKPNNAEEAAEDSTTEVTEPPPSLLSSATALMGSQQNQRLRVVDIWLRPDAPSGDHQQRRLIKLMETVVLGHGMVVREMREAPEATWVVARAASASEPSSTLLGSSAAGLLAGFGSGPSWSSAVLGLGVSARDGGAKERRLRLEFWGPAASIASVVVGAGRRDKGSAAADEQVGGTLVRGLVEALREAGLLLSQLRGDRAAVGASGLDPHYVLELMASYARDTAEAVKRRAQPDEARAREEELRGATLVAALQPAYARHGLPMPSPTRARPLKDFPLEGLGRPPLAEAATLPQARALAAKASGLDATAAARPVCEELAAWAEAEQGAQLRRRRRQVEERVENVRKHRQRLIGVLRDHDGAAAGTAAVEQQFGALFPQAGKATVLVDAPATLEARPGRLYVTHEGLYFHSQILSFSLQRALPFCGVRFVESGGGKGGGLLLAAAAAATGSALAVTDVKGSVHTFFLMAGIDMVDVIQQVLGVWREAQRVAGRAEERAAEEPEAPPLAAALEAGKAADEGKGMEQAERVLEGLTLSASASAASGATAAPVPAPAPAVRTEEAQAQRPRTRSGSALREGLQAFFGEQQPQQPQQPQAQGAVDGVVTPVQSARERRGSRESHSPLLDLDS